MAERALCLNKVNSVHERTDESDLFGVDYLRSTLDGFGVSCRVSETDLARIPLQGPVIVVSNHPYGGIDAIMLLELLARQRKDTRIMANHLLMNVPKAAPFLLPVNPFGGTEAARQNLSSMRAALKMLRAGGMLATFPSGTVAHFHWSKRGVVDPTWSPHVAALIRKSGATVLPVYFPGRNSTSFQLAGLVHPLLRTALIPRETVKRKGQTIRLRIGNPIPFSNLTGFDSDEQLMRFLRLHTYLLRETKKPKERRLVSILARRGQMAPVADPVDKETLALEIEALPSTSVLFTQDKHRIYVAAAAQIPNTLKEIGRLRESTFREVGEGSGNRLDLDRFDDSYYHLFLWNAEELEIAGAYRLGLTDQLIEKEGKRGLYTATLFKFKPGFVENLGPAIELGRSFITTKYQRQHNSLSLLWKGVCHFVSRNPEYKILFGPVSISQEYNKISKRLLVQFLTDKLRHPSLASFVKPSHRFRGISALGFARENISDSVRDINDVSALISEVEQDGKGVPVLLKQYLRMNSLLLSFNVDKKFSNVLDGLMMADLTGADPRLLKRYFGAENARNFLKYHQDRESPTPAP
ncbi:MAG: lysophospholipid acyltransferase family protein [Verrucomicrobiota bacterium]